MKMPSDKNRNMQVVLRVRPLSQREMEQNQRRIISVADCQNVIFDPEEDEDEFFFRGTKQTHRDITKRVSKNLTMSFDHVFDHTSTNVDIFELSMRPLVSSVMQGFNCSAFVYGATGSGKTYTMLGNEQNPGITYLTMKELFTQINAHIEERKFDIGISYLEVYNEQIMNLLTKSGPLKLREDSNGVVVGGLVLKPIFSADELLSLLALGNRNRTQHPTDANAESSRSHAIFQVHIRMTNKKSGEKRTVKLSMIDLAGSERGSSTKFMGQRFKEGASINKSLLALGNCINKLADGSKHIPYRDSNMTRILKDSLGGNCKTVMIANISPSSLTYEDTYNTLKYASRAQQIRTTAIKENLFKTNLPKEFYIRKLTETTNEVENMKKYIRSLELKLNERNNMKNITPNSNQSDKLFEARKEKIDQIYRDMRIAQENYYIMSSKEKLLKLRSKYKEMNEQNRHTFDFNSDYTKRDISRVEASIGKYNKQIEVYRIDKDRWMGRFKASQNELIQIVNEINDKKNVILQSHLMQKDMEQKNIELKLKLEHAMKVIHFYNQESDKTRKIVDLSSELLRESYLILSGNILLTDEMREKYNQIVKMYDHKSVKFSECDDLLEKQNNQIEFLCEHDPLITNDEHGIIDNLVQCQKRNREEDIEVPSEKRFARPIFGQPKFDGKTMETHESDSLNATFAIKPSVEISVKSAPINALKESNPNVFKTMVQSKPIIKKTSDRLAVKSATIGFQRQKENKRTPISLRKSPKNLIRTKPKINEEAANRIRKMIKTNIKK